MAPLRLAFAGTPDFAAWHLAALLDSPHCIAAVLTQPDRRSGRGKKARPGPVKTLAAEHDLPVMQPTTLRDEQTRKAIAALEVDALVVVAYGLLLPQTVLDLPRYGCLNVHGSLLPRWRGAAPIQRAIEAGDRESGVTIMLMDAGLDTGPMLARSACEITPDCSSGDLYAELGRIGPKLLLEVLGELPEKLRHAEAQDDALATLAPKISKAEALVDWTEPAAVLARRIRAFDPHPGCYSFLGGLRVKLWAADSDAQNAAAEPGTIIGADSEGITVACGAGALRLQRLQLPGARALPVADLLRGRPELFSSGARFGAADGE